MGRPFILSQGVGGIKYTPYRKEYIMSILQEYQEIRRDIGEDTYHAIEKYLNIHKDLYLSDIYYKRAEWEKFENWRKEVK